LFVKVCKYHIVSKKIDKPKRVVDETIAQSVLLFNQLLTQGAD